MEFNHPSRNGVADYGKLKFSTQLMLLIVKMDDPILYWKKRTKKQSSPLVPQNKPGRERVVGGKITSTTAETRLV